MFNYYQYRNELMDCGPQPFVVDIKKATECNEFYRVSLWTGNHLQLTVMSIPVGGDIGLEMHPNVDQFLKIEEGCGLVQMGNRQENITLQQMVYEDNAIFVPAKTWHNLLNVGQVPLKLYTIYAPKNHPWGTVHQTKEIAESMEHHEST